MLLPIPQLILLPTRARTTNTNHTKRILIPTKTIEHQQGMTLALLPMRILMALIVDATADTNTNTDEDVDVNLQHLRTDNASTAPKILLISLLTLLPK